MGSQSNDKPSSGLPHNASLYEREYDYWPWGGIIEYVARWVVSNAPQKACVLDYMCGTGALLHKAMLSRPDMACFGCSLTREYISFARKAYPGIHFECCDARDYVPQLPADIVLCTAGLHHLPFDSQAPFVAKVASELKSRAFFVVAEELIAPWATEKERRRAVLDLSSGVIAHMIAREAPSEVIGTAVDVLRADILLQEFKIDRDRLLKMLDPFFDVEHSECIWPHDKSESGDCVFICRKRD